MSIALWNVETEKLEQIIESKSIAQWISFSPDGTLVIGCQENGGVVGEVATGKTLAHFPIELGGDGGQIASVWGILHDGMLLTAGPGQEPARTPLFAWDRVTRQRKELIRASPGKIRAVSPNLTFVVFEKPDPSMGRSTSSLSIWSLKEGRELAEYGVALAPRNCVFSPDEKTLALAGIQDGSVRLWDLSEFLPKSE